MEIYKDVRGFEGLYRVSNLGNVESVEREIPGTGRFQEKRILKRKLLKPGVNKGYLGVILRKDKKQYNKYVHRLVGECFLEGEQIGLVINHKNMIKTDNRAENLEWCTHQYNIDHGKGKPVIQISLIDNSIIKEYPTASAAARYLGIHQGPISSVCRGVKKTSGGYKWKYKN